MGSKYVDDILKFIASQGSQNMNTLELLIGNGKIP